MVSFAFFELFPVFIIFFAFCFVYFLYTLAMYFDGSLHFLRVRLLNVYTGGLSPNNPAE